MPHRVRAWLSNGVRLSGIVHVDDAERLSDHLNRPGRIFVAITGTHVQWPHEDEMEDTPEVLLLRKDGIDMILPIDPPR